MLQKEYPFYLAGKPVHSDTKVAVLNKYNGEVATHVCQANAEQVDQAIAAAVSARAAMEAMPSYKRQEVLEHCVRRFTERREELAQALCVEAGKPLKDSRGEVQRLIETFKIAAEEAVRIGGEVIPMDINPRTTAYTGMTKRVPIGPCSFITPFNFPLNLVAHKVAPALAAGCPFILKPAERTPIGAVIIGEILAETELPEGAFSILPCKVKNAAAFSEDDRLKLLSFTGGPQVGWMLKARAGRKKVVLELGGNAAVIVDKDANLDDAADRIIVGAFYQSGQTCIAVQRIFAHRDIHAALRDKVVERTKKLIAGDPSNEETFVGPLISEADAQRLMAWVDEAVSGGATLLCGGTREGAVMAPTLVENLPTNCRLCDDEAFGPVAGFMPPFDDFDEALARVNDSDFGLQAGVFTRDIVKIQEAWDTLEVGGVIINDVPSWRVDHMPYGGVKGSGIGREGIRYAIEDMTEIRLLALRNPPAAA